MLKDFTAKEQVRLNLDEMECCVFCRRDERRPESISCQACHDFISGGTTARYSDIQFLRFGALLAASQMGFRGEFSRAIAREVDKHRLELWGD